jgi:hypothetical protein
MSRRVLTTCDAQLALFDAIRAAGKVGNPTDDKLILAALNERGVYLVVYPTEIEAATDAHAAYIAKRA